MPSKEKPLEPGTRYGKWTVIERAENKHYTVIRYKVICDCGYKSIVNKTELVKGRSTRCKSCAMLKSHTTYNRYKKAERDFLEYEKQGKATLTDE